MEGLNVDALSALFPDDKRESVRLYVNSITDMIGIIRAVTESPAPEAPGIDHVEERKKLFATFVKNITKATQAFSTGMQYELEDAARDKAGEERRGRKRVRVDFEGSSEKPTVTLTAESCRIGHRFNRPLTEMDGGGAVSIKMVSKNCLIGSIIE
jgi:hypothetical protein